MPDFITPFSFIIHNLQLTILHQKKSPSPAPENKKVIKSFQLSVSWTKNKEENIKNWKMELNLKATELRLGLPGTELEPCTSLAAKTSKKRCLSEMDNSLDINHDKQYPSPAPKAQIIGWPPVKSYRKNVVQALKLDTDVSSGIYVKVSMDGAPYLRKIDLRFYKSYQELLKALENMFKHPTGIYLEKEGNTSGSDYVPTYEDKDGDWMLVGDVPWDMFINSCKRLRIMKGSEAKGLACLL